MKLVDYTRPIEWIRAFFDSLKTHYLNPSQFGLSVELEYSENTYLTYPVKGIIKVVEQGVSLGISQAVFHAFNEETGTFGPPVTVKNPVFIYRSH